MAQEIYVDLGFNASDDVAFATIESVFGQLSDGKWENSPKMTGYWLFADVVKNDVKICLKVSTKGFDNSIFKKGVYNPYINMRSKQIMEKMANFVKAIVKDEHPAGWDRKNTAKCDYLSRGNITVRVCDAYRVYDALKQRKPKVYASVAKELVKIAKGLVAREPDLLPWTFKESEQVENLIKVTKNVEKKLKLWLSFYESGEGNNYGYDCESGIKNTTKALALCSNMKEQLKEAYKAMIAFSNALE
jgi:hypothetical protein